MTSLALLARLFSRKRAKNLIRKDQIPREQASLKKMLQTSVLLRLELSKSQPKNSQRLT